MEKFTTLTAIAAPLLRINVDTDAIIPSREMKRVSKDGLSEGLFAGWRYQSPGSRGRLLTRMIRSRCRSMFASQASAVFC